MPPDPSFGSLSGIEWDDTESILAGTIPVLAALADDRVLLAAMIDNIAADPGLADKCEGYDFMRKLVLYDDPDLGVRLRLHLYGGGFFDRPHNHRWSFASRIVRGSYTHRVFGHDSEFDESTDPTTLQALMTRREQPGATYALHHTSVHSVTAEADTVSLIVRGPAAKQRFLIHDAAKHRFFWSHGAQHETPQQRDRKRLSPDQLATALTDAHALITTPTTERIS